MPHSYTSFLATLGYGTSRKFTAGNREVYKTKCFFHVRANLFTAKAAKSACCQCLALAQL